MENGVAVSKLRKEAEAEAEEEHKQQEAATENNGASSNGHGRRRSSKAAPPSDAAAESDDGVAAALANSDLANVVVPGRYYWPGPTQPASFGRAWSHLETLTGESIQFRATQASFSITLNHMHETINSILDAQSRARRVATRESHRQNRRWFGLMVLIATYLLFSSQAGAFLRQAVASMGSCLGSSVGAQHCVSNFFSVVVPVGVSALWVALFPLIIVLWIHRCLGQWSMGKLSLGRAAGYLVGGLGMQLPFLAWTFVKGLEVFEALRTTPFHVDASINAFAHQVFDVAAFMFLAAVDYTFVLLHQHINTASA